MCPCIQCSLKALLNYLVGPTEPIDIRCNLLLLETFHRIGMYQLQWLLSTGIDFIISDDSDHFVPAYQVWLLDTHSSQIAIEVKEVKDEDFRGVVLEDMGINAMWMRWWSTGCGGREKRKKTDELPCEAVTGQRIRKAMDDPLGNQYVVQMKSHCGRQIWFSLLFVIYLNLVMNLFANFSKKSVQINILSCIYIYVLNVAKKLCQ